MKQLTCPKCFARHESEEILFSCTHDGCSREGMTIPMAELMAQDGKFLCPSCKSILTERLCPDCGYPIVSSEDETPNLPISIVGAEGCGKSNYLSVLIDQLRHRVSKVYDCALYPMGGDETIQQYDHHYYQPLFVKGQCLFSTQQDEINPLMYSMVFSGNPPAGKTCNLTFYDACGANFKSEQVMADYNRSIYNAKGLLLFVDPAQLPVSRDFLVSKGTKLREQEDVSVLLSRTIHLIRQSSGLKNIRRKLEIPIAVCLTKTDAIKPLLDASSFLRYPSRHLQKPVFDNADFASTSLEVQSLIESWSGVELVNQITSQFAHCGFFGISSLGASPNKENQIHHISPHRVPDPLLWVLWKNNIIRATSVE